MTSKSRRRLRRRLSAALLLLVGLLVAGGLAATLTPKPQVAVADESSLALLRTGKQLFETSCVTCHGANLQGVHRPRPQPDRRRRGGGLLPGVHRPHARDARRGAGAAEAARSSTSTRSTRSAPTCRPTAAARPCRATPTAQVAQQSLIGDDVARGGDLFRLNCASCHNFTGKGGALSSGKYAPRPGRRPSPRRSTPRC